MKGFQRWGKKIQNSKCMKKTGEITAEREHSGIRTVFTSLKGSKFLDNKGSQFLVIRTFFT